MKNNTKEVSFLSIVAILYTLPLLILYSTIPNYGFGSLYLTIFGLILFLIGIVLWAWGFFSLGNLFYILPKPIKVTKRGIYRYISHPIYIGIVMVFGGLSISLGSLPGLLYSIIILIPFNILRACLEAKYLRIEA